MRKNLKWLYIALGGYIGFLPLMTILFMTGQEALNESIGASRPNELDEFYSETVEFLLQFLPFQVIIGILLVLFGVFLKRLQKKALSINLALFIAVLAFCILYHINYRTMDLSIFTGQGVPSWIERMIDISMIYGIIVLYLFYLGPLVFATYILMRKEKVVESELTD
jgi:hypothetical protein